MERTLQNEWLGKITDLILPLPETVQDRVKGAIRHIEQCEGDIPVEYWCMGCLTKLGVVVRYIRAERSKAAMVAARAAINPKPRF